jgi:uncharacterized membrane protein
LEGAAEESTPSAEVLGVQNELVDINPSPSPVGEEGKTLPLMVYILIGGGIVCILGVVIAVVAQGKTEYNKVDENNQSTN